MMRTNSVIHRAVGLAAVLTALLLMSSTSVRAHCDAVNGPVAAAARKALETEQFRPIAIWVGKAQEGELREAFERSAAVHSQGGEAGELAERYFVETAVRLHREAEGFPYKGLEPASPLPPDLAAAEEALETGDPAPLLDLLSRELRNEVETWFQKARAARAQRDTGLQAGREWVDAYVKYVIYVHGLHKTIHAGPKHGVGD